MVMLHVRVAGCVAIPRSPVLFHVIGPIMEGDGVTVTVGHT